MAANPKVTLGFDATPLTLAAKSGVGYYSLGLLAALAGKYPEELEIVAHFFDFGNKVDIAGLPRAKNIHYVRTVWAPRQVFYMLRRFGIPIAYEWFLKRRVDFFLFPNFLGWPSLHKTPSAPVIHDLYYLEHPEQVSRLNQYDLQHLVPKTLRRSAFVIAISEVTAKALGTAYPDIQRPVVVSHVPPVNLPALAVGDGERLIKQLGITGRFILFLGNIEPRKNLGGLLDAYRLLPEKLRGSYGLVIAGGKGWKDEPVLRKLSDMQSEGLNIIQTGYVSDEQKAALYQAASVFVLPSLYEGFGMPLLEAMSYDTPVLASDIPVFREVASDAVLYTNPLKSDDMAARLEQLLLDDDLQRTLAAKGRKRLEKFSWEQTAAALYKAIREEVGKA